MISSGQFVNGLWLGTLLIALGLVPGVLESSTRALIVFSVTLQSRLRRDTGLTVPALRSTRSLQRQPRWLAATGAAIILLALYGYTVS